VYALSRKKNAWRKERRRRDDDEGKKEMRRTKGRGSVCLDKYVKEMYGNECGNVRKKNSMNK